MIADRHVRASRCGAPDEAWRITIMSGAIASMLRTVSSSDSPLVTLDVAVAMLSVSALSRFSAISNDVRVRVLGSKNRLTTVRPRSVGTFLIARPPISFIASAVSRISVISSGVEAVDPEQVPRPQRGRGGRRLGTRSCVHPRPRSHFVGAVDLLQPHLDALLRARSAGSCRRSPP